LAERLGLDDRRARRIFRRGEGFAVGDADERVLLNPGLALRIAADVERGGLQACPVS
jgi:hypothetical protein